MKLINSFLLSVVTASALLAQNLNIATLNSLKYEDAFEKKAEISENVKLVILSFEKGTGSLMADFLNAKDSTFLADTKTVYIADIHSMPSFVTYMFARPKMQKYNFRVVLYNEDDKLDKMVVKKEDALTVLVIDEKSNVIETKFVKSKEEVRKLF